MTQHRSPLDMHYDILLILLQLQRPVSNYYLSNKVQTASTHTQKHLYELLAYGLAKADHRGITITKKGAKFVEVYQQMRNLIPDTCPSYVEV